METDGGLEVDAVLMVVGILTIGGVLVTVAMVTMGEDFGVCEMLTDVVGRGLEAGEVLLVEAEVLEVGLRRAGVTCRGFVREAQLPSSIVT